MVLLVSFGHTRSLMSSSIYARKWSKHQLTIPLNPIHSRMLGMDPDVFLLAVVRCCMCSA
ncbi:hypothetical protein HOY80DRAFT_958548 [Tuber brumale]|nr:hypothetical protein HOY80DRAFT_958548 [Tuber brumale]